MPEAMNHARLTSTITASGVALWMLTGCAGGTNAATVTELNSPGADVAESCAELTADNFPETDVAFRGTVMKIENGQVTLSVDTPYQGRLGENVTVAQQTNDVPSEFTAGAFVEGEQYLIAAQDESILTCGISGPATAELTTIYDSVF